LIFLAVIGTAILAYELIAWRKGTWFTISEVVWDKSYDYPWALPFLIGLGMGLLGGHLFL
jgi:hypothetical protein